MERFIILMAAALLQTSAFAQSNNNTVVINNPKRVTIVTGDSIQKVIVKGKEGDDNYEYSSTIQLVDSNYVSKEEINKDSWFLKDIFPDSRWTPYDWFHCAHSYRFRHRLQYVPFLGVCPAVH